MTTMFDGLLTLLSQNGVEFIVIGGVAGIAHGAARTTLDLDVVYRRTEENFKRIVSSLADCSPYPRGAPLGLPFKWDERTLKNGVNFTLTTTIGFIDLLGEISGGGNYENLVGHTKILKIFGAPCQCLVLPKLIEVKRAAGRPKDFEAIAELELINERGLVP